MAVETGLAGAGTGAQRPVPHTSCKRGGDTLCTRLFSWKQRSRQPDAEVTASTHADVGRANALVRRRSALRL